MASWVWGTPRSYREPYQESKEPGKSQESSFSPEKSESSARNVLEHCRDGGANCLLTTIPIFCAAQHDVRDGGHLCSTLWWLFDPVCVLVVYNDNSTRALSSTSLKCCMPSTEAIDSGKNSRMPMMVQGYFMQARFIEIHQIFTEKKCPILF